MSVSFNAAHFTMQVDSEGKRYKRWEALTEGAPVIQLSNSNAVHILRDILGYDFGDANSDWAGADFVDQFHGRVLLALGTHSDLGTPSYSYKVPGGPTVYNMGRDHDYTSSVLLLLERLVHFAKANGCPEICWS